MTAMETKAIQVARVLQANGHEAVFAGGWVRDMVMGVPCNDIDIATSATPDQVEALFEKTIPVGKSFGVVRVIFEGEEFEVATFRTDSATSDGRRPDSVEFSTMEEDAKRRDFTIGGMFFDPMKKVVIDFVGGRKDIEAGRLRFIGDPHQRIQEDKLRLLRAVRFAVRFGFEIDPESFEAICERHGEVAQVSSERIQEELVKMLKLGKPRQVVELLMATGMMGVILPEIRALKGVQQDPMWHPEGDVLEHTIRVLEGLVGEPVELQLAGLFHDVGKPETTIVEGDRVKTPGHAKAGASIARDILARLKFPKKVIEGVGELVYSHMAIISVPDMRKARQRRFLAREDFEALRKLHIADKQGGSGGTDSIDALDAVVEKFAHEEKRPTPFVDGRDLIEIGFKEGKEIGALKEELFDLQLEGSLTDRESALKFARERFEGA